MIGMTEDGNIGMEGFEGMLGVTRGYCQGWRDQQVLSFQVLLEVAVAGGLVRTNAEVMASVERGRRECRYSGRVGERNLHDSA
jgi:hypothetical protein